MSGTKTDIINNAYSKLRISGLTIVPSNEDNELALDRLESLAAELEGRNINIGYAFEETPDLNTPHNVDRKFWASLEDILALRLCPDFGKLPSPTVIAGANTGAAFLSSNTAIKRQTQYPSRMPIGSGNRRFRQPVRFNVETPEVPMSAKSKTMNIDDVNDFVESFTSYLKHAETISSFTIEADTGLTIVSSAISDNDNEIEYRIQADTASNFLQVKIVVTTDDSRIETRLIDFEVIDTEL